jgi:hypothetical protein
MQSFCLRLPGVSAGIVRITDVHNCPPTPLLEEKNLECSYHEEMTNFYSDGYMNHPDLILMQSIHDSEYIILNKHI